jgi:MFS family permease
MTRRRWVIFGICASLFLMSQFYRVSSAIIAPDLSRDLGLNSQELGLLGAIFFYVFALVQPPLGLLLDRVGARITMVVLNSMAVIGAIIFAHAGGLPSAVIGRGLLGLGMAANLMGTLKLFTKWFDLGKFATTTGLLLSMGAMGTLAATSPLALLVQALGWRQAFYALACFNVFFTTCLWIFVRDAPKDKCLPTNTPWIRTRPPSAWTSMKALFTTWNYWAISLSIFLRYGSFASIQALWAGPFLMVYLGLSAVTAGNLLLMISVGFIIGSPLGGMLSDRILKSRKRTLILALFIKAAAILTLAQWQGTSHLHLLATVLFLMGFFASFNQLSFAHIMELMPRDMSGTAMAGINFFTMLGAGLFIHGLGAVMQRTAPNLSDGGEAYRTAFLICFAAILMALALYFTTRDPTVARENRSE